MHPDIAILRALARDYAAAAAAPRNDERRTLHRACNDLRMIRPVVLIDEIPWPQMDFDGSLTCRCEDPLFREVEWGFRWRLFKFRHFPADMILPPHVGIPKITSSTGIGIQTHEEILRASDPTDIVSHAYVDQLKDEADLEKLVLPTITYEAERTRANWNRIGEAIGDIVPVKIVGRGYLYFATWDEIPRYHGVENVFLDLVDRPEFMHAMVRKITAIKMHELAQWEALGLLDTDPETLHCTAALVSDLPGDVGDTVTRKNIWGRGMAQIFGSVSAEMHKAFDIDYMIDTIGSCGLAYYGCCEPLHNKVDLVAKIPNLRKIGCTPWADVDVEAEAVGKRFVLSVKTNPAAVAVPRLEQDVLRKEIRRILDACHRNGCSCDITLKDISTCRNRPENLVEWERTVMELVQGY